MHLFRLSILLFTVVGLGLFLTGCVYLTVDQFMPYHAQAIQLQWHELDANHQFLFLGLIRGLGGGALVAGAGILYMAIHSWRGDPEPFLLLLPALAIIYSALLTYATYTVYSSTQAEPPLPLIVSSLVASVIAATALWLWRRGSPRG